MSQRLLSPEELVELSAFLDGELDAIAAARVRERVASDAALEAALRELEAVDRELRAIPLSEVSKGLKERMRARLDAEVTSSMVVPLGNARRRGAAPGRFLRRSVYAAAAIAATIAVALLIRTQIAGGPEPTIAPAPAPVLPHDQRVEKQALPELEEPELIAPTLPRPSPTLPERLLAPEPPEPSVTLPQPERIAAPTPSTPVDPLEVATDEELSLALELEAVGANADDLAIIEQLEFVEMLRDLEARGRGRG